MHLRWSLAAVLQLASYMLLRVQEVRTRGREKDGNLLTYFFISRSPALIFGWLYYAHPNLVAAIVGHLPASEI